MLLTDFDALSFDCYGTLIDWESGMIEALKGLTDRTKRPLSRDQILEAHARHEAVASLISRRPRIGGSLRAPLIKGCRSSGVTSTLDYSRR